MKVALAVSLLAALFAVASTTLVEESQILTDIGDVYAVANETPGSGGSNDTEIEIPVAWLISAYFGVLVMGGVITFIAWPLRCWGRVPFVP